MGLEPYLQVGQIIASIALIIVVMLQSRSMAIGQSSNDSSIFRTRRGLEKTLFQLTIVLSVVFLFFSIASVRFIQL
ncbi:MAG: preprotein translocase subunit SecG [Dehalococcoidia bacterium]|nr:preprotein translocase subunit SecG [Dehalococcoidia bacterium]